jgi:outer membrane protein OmpA-like peptidoglycan-associated protein
LYDLGRIGEALAAANTAVDYTEPQVPKALRHLRRLLDQRLATEVLSADGIVSVLSATRSIGATPRIDIYISFNTDQDQPNAAGTAQLAELSRALRRIATGKQQVLVAGHADRSGRCAHNQDLSDRRAQSLARLLQQADPSLKGRLLAVGYGESRPRYPDDSDDSYRLNRRVEIVLPTTPIQAPSSRSPRCSEDHRPEEDRHADTSK